MSAKLRILLRVIQRRVDKGETLESILFDYPALTDEENAIIKSQIK